MTTSVARVTIATWAAWKHAYAFTTLDALLADFERDVTYWKAS
ncbi:hypothetical protein [Ottowia sp.]|jgi:hypothetical protein|nr:hypothetical protein [Ottowia sp.]